MTEADISEKLQKAVREAHAQRRPLAIRAGNSKAFYGREVVAEILDVSAHRGIVSYEPTELVLTARAGTPLKEIEALLAQHEQLLPFEPPHFSEHATLGGCVACGLSGPRRPYAGAVRDFVLGVSLITGTGDRMHFGGEVMKNVAGYDIARLMCGALGTLGVLLEISVKVLPKPQQEMSCVRPLGRDEALTLMNEWAGQSLPLSACAYFEGQLYYRLSGTAGAATAAARNLGGEPLDNHHWWNALKEQRLDFFQTDTPLWRISVAPDAPALDLPGEQLIDWGGAQRWLLSKADPSVIFNTAASAGGHATLFRGGDRRGPVFQTLAPPLRAIHQRLKTAFDPRGILNPGKMYPEF
jgi:glycolate oxidase FAD binding subunit